MMDKIKKKYEDILKADKIITIFSDLDNTLWDGILAEKQKLRLRKNYYQFLKKLYKKGIQTFIISKNDEGDVKRAFKQLGIDKEFFTFVVSNWDTKYLNINHLIQQTKLRPETIIFIDDNKLERIEVKKYNPKIHIMDDKNWKLILENHYVRYKKDQPLSEIKARINRYRTSILAHSKKARLKKESIAFLKSLKRELSIGEIPADNLNRFTRLFVETHRINFNPHKFKDYEKALEYLHGRLNKGDKLYAISTRENNVSLGLSGCLVVRIKDNVAKITDATFSCGIIGRDFENKSFLALINIFKKQGIKKLKVFVTLTSTNQRVREILESLNFKKLKSSQSKKDTIKFVYSLDLLKYKPKKTFSWIKVLKTPPELDYIGHPFVMSFFNRYVRPLMKKRFNVINLGSGREEVIGHLEKEIKDEFYDFINKNKIKYIKIDMGYYPEEKNVVANAEDLKNVVKYESQDLVMALELLEHTQHFWKVINEMIRICKIGGHILISVPSFNYPKHEYPIDLWRIGPKTLSSFFPRDYFNIIKLEIEGRKEIPRRIIILVKKIKHFDRIFDIPKGGNTNWKTGLTIFP